MLATIVVLGTVVMSSLVYWVAARGQAKSDERYHEIKALVEKLANAVSKSSDDGQLLVCADPGHVALAKEVAEMRSAVARIEQLAVREGEAYLRGYMVRAKEEDERNGPSLAA